MRLDRDFFEQDTLEVAKSLLGKRLVRKDDLGRYTAGIIVETEAYRGFIDKAAHSYNGETSRTKIMFGAKGHAYIYLIYGMYNCMNITCGPSDSPDAVLLRALEPVEGISVMEKRRNTDKTKNLCSGPGKLCMAMDIHRGLYGVDLISDDRLYLEHGIAVSNITESKRINIDYAEEAKDFLWRFYISGSQFIS